MMRAGGWFMVLFGPSLATLSLVLGALPGILLGAFFFGLGVLVLALRQPERTAEDSVMRAEHIYSEPRDTLLSQANEVTRGPINATFWLTDELGKVTAALKAQTASADHLGTRLLGYTIAICALTAVLCILTAVLAWPELVKVWGMLLRQGRA